MHRSLVALGIAIALVAGVAFGCQLVGLALPQAGGSGDPFLAQPDAAEAATIGEPGRLLAEGRGGDALSGDLVVVAIGAIQVNVAVTGVVAPGLTELACRRDQSTAFAKRTLSGKRVKIFTPTGDEKLEPGMELRAHLVLSAGTNYGLAALEAGAVRLANNVTPARLAHVFRSAQDSAVAGRAGVWATSCPGDLTAGSPRKTSQLSALGLPSPPSGTKSGTRPAFARLSFGPNAFITLLDYGGIVEHSRHLPARDSAGGPYDQPPRPAAVTTAAPASDDQPRLNQRKKGGTNSRKTNGPRAARTS